MKQSRQVGEGWKVPFFSVWVGQAFSLLGSSLVQFALVWWLTEATGSATVLAMATLMAMLPSVFLSPFAGALVDRWNRRLVMMVADGLIALATVGLAAIFLAGAERVWMIYAVMFIRSAGGGFHWAAMQASTSLMVPEKHLSRVAGLNQSLRGGVNIIGPPLGALLLEIVPLQGILGIDVGTAALAILPLLFIRIPQPESEAEAGSIEQVSILEDVRQGFRYVRGWPGLFAVLIMATVINLLLTPASSLMPILVTDHFGGEAFQLGWLESAWGGGVVAGGLILGAWGGFRRRILTSMMGLAGIGLGFLLVGLTPSTGFMLAVGAMFLAGVMNPMTNGPLLSIIQTSVDPGMQGRVFALVQSMATAATPLGMLIAGPVADALGVRVWYIVGGLGCLLMGIGAFFVPAIVHLEEDRAASEAGESAAARMRGGAVDAAQPAE
jgi:DHA3 family macrolide efflux protein-like MFS transporter